MSQFKDDVAQAATAMRSVFEPTPCQENVYLSELYGARIFLKREDLSPVRSYKIRGAYNFFRKRTADGSPENFVCASAGNHAQGFAYVCNRLEKHGVVFMPVTTPQQKIDKTRAFGGSYVSIKLVGDIFDQCNAAALEHAEKNSAVMVPPFDHPDIIEGQATVAHELVAQMADAHIDHVMVAVGGGGLSSGMTRYFEEAGLQPHMHLLEPAGAPSLKTSLAAGERVKLDRVDNFVDGASVALVGAHTFDVLKRYADSDVSLISEDRLCTSLIDMLNIEGMVLEPAGVMAVDALKDFDPEKIKGKTIVCIASGGNFDFERLPEVKERALRYSGLKKYFVLRLPQRPGALKDFLNLLGPDDDIARFEYLKKSARNFGSILIGIETSDAANFTALGDRMTAAGFVWEDITENQLVAGLLV